MKRIFSLLLGFLIVFTAKAGSLDSLWSRANTYFANEQYADAVSVYKEIEQTNIVSADLYFNLGNAYFKQHELSDAILYYERAQRMKPNDEAIRYNLKMAQEQTLDKVEAPQAFFLTTWLHTVRRWADSDTWAVLSLVLVAVTFIFLGLFFFARSIRLRKMSFFATLVVALLVVGSFGFAFTQTSEFLKDTEAIIAPPVITVRSAPDNTGKDLFPLHEGTKVLIIDELAGWQNIRLPDGKEGWIETGNTKRI